LLLRSSSWTTLSGCSAFVTIRAGTLIGLIEVIGASRRAPLRGDVSGAGRYLRDFTSRRGKEAAMDRS
jgi:hypothetical protein